jgi:pyruvate ferredoxin oxidoreductase alpha subunit
MQLETRYLTHAKQGVALETIRQVGADFRAHFGRRSGGLLTTHRLCAATLVVLGLGSAFEAITTAVDDVREHGVSVGAVGLRSFRPFPAQDVGAALLHCERVVMVERALAVGIGGIVSTDVRSALARLPIQTHTVIAGLGNRAISPESLQRALYGALHGTLEELSFLDVNR